MKKILALFLSLILLFTLCGCQGDANSSDTSAPSSVSDDFVKPTEYTAVVTLSINPQFALYLNDSTQVLAVEALNEDAVSVKKDADLTDTELETVIHNLLTTAHQQGFLIANATIDFEMTEWLSTALQIADVLAKAAQAANDTATQLQLTITVNTTDKTGSDSASQPEQDTTSTSSQSNTPPHTHSYSAASCTEPAKCSCGATSGSALGHQWQAATCKTPKTCSVCKVSEGSVAAHNFVNGVCSVCNASNTLNPKTNIKMEAEYVSKNYKPYDADNISAGGIAFYNDTVDGQYALLLEAMFESTPSDRTGVIYNGKTYYRCGAGQTPYKMELTDTEIIIKNSFYEQADTVSAKMVLQSDGNLRVTYSTLDRFAVGDILSISYNGLS